jgi:hypothetical protein
MKRKTIEPHVHSADYDRNFPLIDARGEMRVFNYRRRCNELWEREEKKKREKKIILPLSKSLTLVRRINHVCPLIISLNYITRDDINIDIFLRVIARIAIYKTDTAA